MTLNEERADRAPVLVVFAGQSNMVGHSTAVDGDKPINHKVLAWNNGGETGRWVTARLGQAPFNPAPGQPNNSALHFADLVQRHSGRAVYLVGRPVNGSTLLSWSSLGAPNMARLIGELERALASRELREPNVTHVNSFLWVQGEGDDVGATMIKEPKVTTLREYSSHFHHMVEELGSRPWWQPARTNVIAGELVSNGWLSARNDFYGDPAQWRSIPRMGVARSEGLMHTGDRAHYCGSALQQLGVRMFEAWCQLEH